MSFLRDALRPLVDSQLVPGLAAAVGRGDDLEVVVLGDRSVGGPPMAADSLFRIASITKPIMAAVALTFVADGTLELDQPVEGLLPELASPRVMRSAGGPVDDTGPAIRPITLRHLLTSTSGIGFPSDFSAPVVPLLVERLRQGPPQPQRVPAPHEWMSILAEIPLLHQPGDGFTYNTSFDILGVLIARAGASTLPEVMETRLFQPLGMMDTGFAFPAGSEARQTSYYRAGEDALIEQADLIGQWSTVPPFPSGAGGLVSSMDDIVVFQQMVLGGGGGVLPADLVTMMVSDQLTPAIRDTDTAFLDGQSWGFGGGVDIANVHRWNVIGRYGWVGGTGTAAHLVPSDGSMTVLLTQVELSGPAGSRVLETFWSAAAEQLGHDGP
jgi:CubicO group peptidase (beta-lactamase class C family)